jgi:hypothetical protein
MRLPSGASRAEGRLDITHATRRRGRTGPLRQGPLSRPGRTQHSRRPASTSDLPLLVPSYLVFTVTSDQKAPCLLYSYIRTVRSDGNCLLPFESASFLPIYHYSITSPSFYQGLCLLYCTEYSISDITITGTRTVLLLLLILELKRRASPLFVTAAVLAAPWW